MCLLLHLFEKNRIIIDAIIPPKSNQSLCFAIVIATLYFLSLYTIILDDYFKKYWLYDSKTKRCYIL